MTAGRALGASTGLLQERTVCRPCCPRPSCPTVLRRLTRSAVAIQVAFCLIAILNVVALAIMAATEVDLVANAAFLLAWTFLNFFWLALFRRPITAALVSLEIVVALILLSQFKHDKLWMTVDFIDLMIIDQDTSAFLLTAIPSLRVPITLAATATAALLAVAWRLDPFRIRVRTSLIGSSLCMGALIALSLSFPTGLYEDFFSQNYVSKFARTGVEAIRELIAHGYLESDVNVAERLESAGGDLQSFTQTSAHYPDP